MRPPDRPAATRPRAAAPPAARPASPASDGQGRPGGRQRAGDPVLTAGLLAFLLLATAYGLVTPLFEGPDEHWHYAYVRHLASGRGLPVQPPEVGQHHAFQEASQPPLYYLLGAALSGWVPSDDFPSLLRPNPQAVLHPLDYRDNQNRFLHSAAEAFPFRGAALAAHLVRLLSTLLGAGTILGTYLLGRTLFPNDRLLALAGAGVVAFTPGFLFSSSLVSNDSLVVFLATLGLLLCARIALRGPAAWPVVALGATLGGAALAKLSGLLLWPLAALALAAGRLALPPQPLRRRLGALLRDAAGAYGLGALIAGWWYVRNLVLYGDPTGLNVLLDLMGRRPEGFGLADVLAELDGLRRSYWGVFGWFNVLLDARVYAALDAASVLALAGLALGIVRRLGQRRWREPLAIGFLGLWVLLVVAGLARFTLSTPASQGRLLYPASAAIALLLALGLAELAPGRRARPLVLGGGVAALGALAVATPLLVLAPTYAPPAALTPAQAAAQVRHPAGLRFGAGITLLGYDVDRSAARPGEPFWVTACWQGDGPIAEDYFVFVQLLVEHDLIAAQRDTYHGLGSFPTSRWPAGVVFCDRYPLVVRDTAPPTAVGTISLGLYRADGARLPVLRPDGTPLGDNVRFPGPAIRPADRSPRFWYDWGHRLALVDYQLDRTGLRAGERLTLTLTWLALEDLAGEYVVTVQVADERGERIAHSDQPLRREGPSGVWRKGALGVERRPITVGGFAAPGVYDLRVGVYPPGGKLLTLYRAGQVVPGSGLLSLWRLRVLPPEVRPVPAPGGFQSTTRPVLP